MTRTASQKGDSTKADLQDLRYTYDPTGNITAITDAAQQTLYFNNQVVSPSCKYTYDAVYRLIDATGREHIGQNGNPPNPYDLERSNLPQPGDGNAVGLYREQYIYDAVGNFLEMQHRDSAPSTANWIRKYTYYETSQTGDGKKSNRLSSTSVGSEQSPYHYDKHGNMIQMPHLSKMDWDYRDRLIATSRTIGSAAETTYYTYDLHGERVRKITESSTGTRKQERIYVGRFEVYREYNGDGTTVSLERETLHVMVDKQRIALVERRTQGTEGEALLIRYQMSNHLGTACLELDQSADIISYEEFTPYGSAAYQAVRNGLDKNPKRYRYTGKERDEENGLSYHGARYYASWLARWVSCDPMGIGDGLNIYNYVNNRPVGSSDQNGMWEMPSTRTILLVAAVVTVAVVVTVVTARVGTAALGAAVGAAGLTGAAATTATAVGTVAVGAAAGAAGSVAATATAQVATTGTIDTNELKTAGISGAVAGAATAGIGSAISAVSRGSVAAVQASRATAVASRAVSGAGMGIVGGGTYEATRQQVSGEREKQGGFDTDKIGSAMTQGAAFGSVANVAIGARLERVGKSIFDRSRTAGLALRSAPSGRAIAARDALVAASKAAGNFPSTISAAENLKTGDVRAMVSGSPPSQVASELKQAANMLGGVGTRTDSGNVVGACSEFHAANELMLQGASLKDVRVTPAIRPRTGQVIPRCSNCEQIFGK